MNQDVENNTNLLDDTVESLNNDSLEKIINHYLILEENTPIQKLIKTILLEEKQTTLGRSDKNDIYLSSLEVSRYHCHINKYSNEETQEIYYEIVDGNIEGKLSNNGLFVNQKKVSKTNLKHGDIINIGSEVTLTYFIDYQGKFQEQKVKILEQKNLVIDTVSDEHDEPTFIATKSNLDYRLDQLLKFASIVNLSPYPIIEIDMKGNILFVNASAKITFPSLLKDKNNHLLLKHILPFPSQLKTDLFKREIKVSDLYFEQYIHYIKDLRIVRLYLFDVTIINKQKENLKQILDYDLKTKLPNYRTFIKTLQKALSSHERSKEQLGVMLIEIDQIDLGKNTLTPKKENNIIIFCSEVLKKIFRLGDTIAYWRNYQFIVLLTQIADTSQIGLISERVIDNLKIPFENDNIQVELKINMGISVYPHDAQNENDLIRKADQALSNSKKIGANKYSFASPKIDFNNQQFSRFSNDINNALLDKEFILYYQPIIDKNHQIIALEALLRWNHKYKGIISPDEFLNVAENQKVINDITLWILKDIIEKKALDMYNTFNQIPVAINISTKLFENEQDCENFIQLIESHIHLTKNLIIEINDNLWVENPLGRNLLKKLLNLGLKIALDDFGIHDSYFTTIKMFPFHYLKIAQDFIKDIKDNSQDKAIVAAISTIAKGFNMEVIVEGIENDLQWIIAQELNCQYGQGYLFSKPLPFEEIKQILDQ